jgi:hypothetical protein
VRVGQGGTCEVGAARPNELHSANDAGGGECRTPVPPAGDVRHEMKGCIGAWVSHACLTIHHQLYCSKNFLLLEIILKTRTAF